MSSTITNAAATQQMVAFWHALTGKAIGTRRPTDFPEWVTIEVAEGGFATGRALAALKDGERSSTAFMADESSTGGLSALDEMLTSGRYRIEQPENAALLSMVWLLKEGRTDEAKELFDTIAPYMDTLRFYPHATEAVTNVSTSAAALTTVGVAKRDIDAIAKQASQASGHRYDALRRQRAVADGYAELQADAIALLLATTPDRAAFLGAGGDSDEGLFATDVDAESQSAILSRAADLAQRYGVVRSHTAPNTTTAMILDALRNPFTVERKALAKRLREAVSSKGLRGSDQNEKYLARARLSAIADQFVAEKARVVAERLATLPLDSTVADATAVLAPLSGSEHAEAVRTGRTAIPPVIARAVRRATAASLEQLVAADVVVSAEMIALVLPSMLAAAAGASIEDPAARRMYTQLSVAFAKRRSLLLVNFEKQVRLEELPWARPILSLIKVTDDAPQARRGAADDEDDDARAVAKEPTECDAVLGEAVRCYLTHFPATITPNKLVSALKDVMRKGVAAKANLVEELAADIFQGSFSPNFDAAAFVAAKAMAGTVYSRYFGLEGVYEGIVARYATAQEEVKALREESKQSVLKLKESLDSGIDYHQKAQEVREEHAKRFYAERGIPLPGYSHFCPVSPRAAEATQKVSEIQTEESTYSQKFWGQPGFIFDNDKYTAHLNERVELFTKPIQQILVDYELSSGKKLVNYEYQYDSYVYEANHTPRTQAALTALEAEADVYQEKTNIDYYAAQKLKQQVSTKLILAPFCEQKVTEWLQGAAPAKRYTVRNGRIIEAAMVLTTHNLAQLASITAETTLKGFDYAAAVLKAWDGVVKTYANPPTEKSALLHARRDTAYAWRQILFLLSRLATPDAQRAVAATMREAVTKLAAKKPAVADALIAQFLGPLDRVIDGKAPNAEGDKSPFVLGYFGWKGFGGETDAAGEKEEAEEDDQDAEEVKE